METTINNLKAISTARIRLKDLHTHEDGDGENLGSSHLSVKTVTIWTHS